MARPFALNCLRISELISSILTKIYQESCEPILLHFINGVDFEGLCMESVQLQPHRKQDTFI